MSQPNNVDWQKQWWEKAWKKGKDDGWTDGMTEAMGIVANHKPGFSIDEDLRLRADSEGAWGEASDFAAAIATNLADKMSSGADGSGVPAIEVQEPQKAIVLRLVKNKDSRSTRRFHAG
jgi:hypothetical protein